MLLFIFILNYVNQSPKDILTDSKNLLESHKNVKLWGHNGRYSHTVETTSSSFNMRWCSRGCKVKSCLLFVGRTRQMYAMLHSDQNRKFNRTSDFLLFPR